MKWFRGDWMADTGEKTAQKFGWESLTGEEQDRIMDFAHRGIGSIGDVRQLLRRLPLQMEIEFRHGHEHFIKRSREESERYRARLRERAREARETKCTRLPASS